ncbi:MAG: hypothetical protein IT364_07675 [Candidatus Hydrogenedentes bacterium]|nr:hypothetical protein [Candidatus Hydrogenedentota bacterium]
MKRKLYSFGTLAVVGIFAIALFGSIAEAKPIIDKGDLGKYERDGKFLRRILTSPSEVGSPGQSAVTSTAREVRYDKGELGTWVRDGRRVSKEVKGVSGHRSSRQGFQEPHYMVVDHIKHIHRFPD